jgi:YVTN family beta-propeller protein
MASRLGNIGGLVVASAAGLLLAGCQQQRSASTPSAPAATGGYRVYVTNEASGDLTVIDGATNAVTATIPLGKRPRGVRVSPDGRTLYIALSGSPVAGPGVDESTLPTADKAADGIAVFDVATSKVLRVIRGVSDPEQLAVSADGKLYIASEDTGQAVVVDAASGAALASVPVGEEPEGVDISPDGSQAWVTSEEDSTVTVLDTRTYKPLKAIAVGKRPRNTAFSPDGRKAYVVGELDRVVKVIDTRSLAVTNTATLPGDDKVRPMGLAVSPNGRRLYVSTGRGGQVLALDANSLSSLGAAKAGTRVWGIALSPDGSRLYSANGPSNDVTVVDAATMATIATVPAGRSPWSLAIVPTPAP